MDFVAHAAAMGANAEKIEFWTISPPPTPGPKPDKTYVMVIDVVRRLGRWWNLVGGRRPEVSNRAEVRAARASTRASPSINVLASGGPHPEFDGKVLVATGGASLIVEARHVNSSPTEALSLGDLTTDHAHNVLSEVGDAALRAHRRDVDADLDALLAAVEGSAGWISRSAPTRFSGADTWRQHANSGIHRWM